MNKFTNFVSYHIHVFGLDPGDEGKLDLKKRKKKN